MFLGRLIPFNLLAIFSNHLCKYVSVYERNDSWRAKIFKNEGQEMNRKYQNARKHFVRRFSQFNSDTASSF